MRVVGGRLKGRNLASPSSRDIRPTADRLRESVFNILVHAYDNPIEGARVLDLFAGTGALGIEVDGVKYGPIDATLERDQGANVWLVFAIREGKNREVRNVMAHLGLEVNRLIRVSYGPFQLGEIEEGKAEEVKTRVLRDQLGEKVIAQAGCEFEQPGQRRERDDDDPAPRGKKPFKPAGRSSLVNDRKGRRVLVQRTGSAEARARNEEENAGYGPPRRPKRGYHGKRDFKPRDE